MSAWLRTMAALLDGRHRIAFSYHVASVAFCLRPVAFYRARVGLQMAIALLSLRGACWVGWRDFYS